MLVNKIALISWDSSFRNFFGGIESLDKNLLVEEVDIEIILVEQRSRTKNISYHEKWLTKPIEEISDELKNVSVKVIYLDDDRPYDIGRLLGVGLIAAQESKPDLIGIFDCDQIFPTNFLSLCLKEAKVQQRFVFNLARLMAVRPSGTTYEHWVLAKKDYRSVFEECENKKELYNIHVHNKFPLIMAKASLWNKIRFNDYDVSLFKGNATRLGLLVNTLLENSQKCNATAFPGSASVHPWHPTGASKRELEVAIKLYLQLKSIREIRSKLLFNDFDKVHDVLVKYDELYQRIKKLPKPILNSRLLGSALYIYMLSTRYFFGREVKAV